MATLTKRMRGDSLMFEIQWYVGKQRKTIPLGKRYNERTAMELKNVVETLVYCKDNSVTMLDKRTLAWLESASTEIREKLAKAGLFEIPPERTIRELWDAYLLQKTDIKKSTRDGYDYAEERLFSFFKGNELLTGLTSEQFADLKDFLRTDYRSPLTDKPLVESTVAGTLAKIKAAFNWAVRKKWIAETPLKGVGKGSYVNREKDYHVTMDEYRRLLDACPCQDWRCIIALARIGGMRAPSEVLRLRWTDINWEKSRFYVTSPKTERYKGKAGRVVPLWPALREELETLFFRENTEGTEYVINRYRNPERSNLGTQFARIVLMAGIEPIEKPFNNMRASRSTEVYAEYGAFLESKWIGHSTKIARDHYLQVREEDFERAVGGFAPKQQEKNTRKRGFPAVDKNLPAVFPAARAEIDQNGSEAKKKKKVGKP